MFVIYNNSASKKTILINTVDNPAETAKIISIKSKEFSEPLPDNLLPIVDKQGNEWAIIFASTVLAEMEGNAGAEATGKDVEQKTNDVPGQDVDKKEGSEEQPEPQRQKAKRGRKKKVQNN